MIYFASIQYTPLFKYNYITDQEIKTLLILTRKLLLNIRFAPQQIPKAYSFPPRELSPL